MEVHSHLHTPRKKWTHYFWEFLMLFLAVFCGFLAENLREHQVEKIREKQYMASMVEDLIADTSMLNSLAISDPALVNKFDSLKTLIYDVNNVENNKLIIYRLNAETRTKCYTSFSDRTASQLRNSGGMRLIRKAKIANAISRYWKESSNLEFTAENYNRRCDGREEMSLDIFNSQYTFRRLRDTLAKLYNYSIKPEAELMTNDKHLLLNYANRIDRLQETIERLVLPKIKSEKIMAKNLIDLIRKEYHLN